MLMPALFDGSFDRPESLVVNDQDAIFMSPPLVARKKLIWCFREMPPETKLDHRSNSISNRTGLAADR